MSKLFFVLLNTILVFSVFGQTQHIVLAPDSNRYLSLLRSELSKDSTFPNSVSKHNIWVAHYYLDNDTTFFLPALRNAIAFDPFSECDGYTNPPWKRRKPLFDSILEAMMVPVCKTAYSSLDSGLMRELDTIKRDDLLYRTSSADKPWVEGNGDKWTLQNILDSINQKKISQIIDRVGYPGKSLVSYKYWGVAVSVIQHASLHYQEKYLPAIRLAVKNLEVNRTWLPMLIDRINMRKGIPQVYGTQSIWNDERKRLELYTTENLENIDKTRSNYGLGPLNTYMKSNSIFFPTDAK